MRLNSSKFLAAIVAGALIAVVPGPNPNAQEQGQGQGPDQNNGLGDGQGGGRPEWAASLRHDTSGPLRDITPLPGRSTREDFEVKRGHPETPGAPDTQIQDLPVAPLAAIGGAGFDGVGEGNAQFAFTVNYAPPDTVGEAGLTQFVQWVNPSFAIFDKATGNRIYGPAAGNTIWQGFGGDCETRNDGDPMVQYDQLADRWVMSQFSLRQGNYLQCVAISKTSDATGQWHRYAFSYNHFPDYPKLAVWPDAYYMTFNMFGTAGQMFTGGRVCAYDRAKMLDGLPATQVCFNLSGYSSFLASDLEGKTLPPAGSPNYVMTRSGGGISLFKFKPNFAAPGSSTFTGPTAIPVTGYTIACPNCVPQPGTTQKLDTLSDRLMYRLSYRNLGNREAMVVNHSVAANNVVGVRWYEFAVNNFNVTVRQQSTYAPNDSQYRWMGSTAIDKLGNIALGFSISSGSQKPSIRFAGRETTDPLNSLSMDSSMHAGTGSQLTTLGRWGDYSSMTIDPVDDCTFWYTTEYLQTNGTFNWSTRIGSFKFSSCAPAPAVSVDVQPASRIVAAGQSTTYTATLAAQNGYNGSGNYSVTGLPSGATGTFDPAGFTSGSGSTTLTVTTSGATAPGTYPLTITAKDASNTPSDSEVVTLVVNPPPSDGFSFSASPSTQPIEPNGSAFFSAIVTAQGSYTGSGTFDVSGLPAGTSGSFSPAGYSGGAGNSILTITAGSSIAVGSYPLTITATDSTGTPSHSSSVTLVVNPPASLTVGASPSSQSVAQGDSTTFTATVTPQNGYEGSGSFSVTGLPSGAGGSFSGGYANGGGSSTLTVTTGASTPAGTYQLTIIATDTTGAPVNSTNVSLTVTSTAQPDFALAATPGTMVVKRGRSDTYNVTVTPSGGFNETVSLTVTGLPPSTSASFLPEFLNGGGTSVLTITTANPATPKGTFTLTIIATSESKTRSTTVTLKVQ